MLHKITQILLVARNAVTGKIPAETCNCDLIGCFCHSKSCNCYLIGYFCRAKTCNSPLLDNFG